MSVRIDPRRRALVGAALGLGVGLWARAAEAQSVSVPLRLQVELLAKVAAYDRNFVARARGRVLVLVVQRGDDAESRRVGEQLLGELGAINTIGGLPHAEETLTFTTAKALAEFCKSRGATIVYLSAGLADQVTSIADALEGVSVLTAAVTAAYVPKRCVLGFDAESGKPKLIVHLGQARRQQVAFKPELLKLARVIQ